MNAGSAPPAATFRARGVRPTAGARAYLGSAAAPRSLAKTPRGRLASVAAARGFTIPRRLSAPVVSFPEKRVFLSRRRASPKSPPFVAMDWANVTAGELVLIKPPTATDELVPAAANP